MLLRQWLGSWEQSTLGAPVLTSSPGCSARISDTCLSAHHHSAGYMLLPLSESVFRSVAGPETIVAMDTLHVTRNEN